MLTEGGEEDQQERRNPVDDKDTDDNMESSDLALSEREDSVNKTLPAGRHTENDEQDSQDEVVGYTSAVGTED